MRSAYLFYTIALLPIVLPATQAGNWYTIPTRLIVFGTLLAALFSVSNSRRHLIIGSSLVAVTSICLTVSTLLRDPTLVPVGLTSLGVFCFLLASTEVRKTLQTSRVTSDSLYSAVTAYVVVAFGFACIFEVFELKHPGAFLGRFTSEPLFPTSSMSDMVYYSLTTLSTAGYGDIIPVHPIARNLACFEMLFGTMYPTVILARLVSLHSSSTLVEVDVNKSGQVRVLEERIDTSPFQADGSQS